MYRRIWFSADTHYGHRNILTLCNRQFNSIEEHDAKLISNHNEVVGINDIYYFLGDFSFRCPSDYSANIIKKLNFGKMFLILGNHDKAIRQAIHNGFLDDYIRSGKLEIVGGIQVSEDHSISASKMIVIDGQSIFLSHYSLRTWPGAFRGSFCLYGHSHSNLAPYFKSFDIGVDTETETHRKYYPWSYEEVRDRMTTITDQFRENESQKIREEES